VLEDDWTVWADADLGRRHLRRLDGVELASAAVETANDWVALLGRPRVEDVHGAVRCDHEVGQSPGNGQWCRRRLAGARRPAQGAAVRFVEEHYGTGSVDVER
jgi:hypothetical protein